MDKVLTEKKTNTPETLESCRAVEPQIVVLGNKQSVIERVQRGTAEDSIH